MTLVNKCVDESKRTRCQSLSYLVSPVNPQIRKTFRRWFHSPHVKTYSIFQDNDCATTWQYYEDSSHAFGQKSASAGAFSGRVTKNPVNCSKSVFVPTSHINLPPPNETIVPTTTTTTTKTPQPLSVTGFRSDLFSNHQKSPKKSCLLERSCCTSSFNSLKLSPSKTSSLRWKGKQTKVSRPNHYPDPLHNADTAFMQRISEIAALEVETIKYEKSRKFKRK